MNELITTAVVLALAAAGPAFADDITIDTSAATWTKTRAEVRAELLQARADGTARAWAEGDFLERALQPATPRQSAAAPAIATTSEPAVDSRQLARMTRGAH